MAVCDLRRPSDALSKSIYSGILILACETYEKQRISFSVIKVATFAAHCKSGECTRQAVILLIAMQDQTCIAFRQQNFYVVLCTFILSQTLVVVLVPHTHEVGRKFSPSKIPITGFGRELRLQHKQKIGTDN